MPRHTPHRTHAYRPRNMAIRGDDGLEQHVRALALLIARGICDPAAPTHLAPGNVWKLALLCHRYQRGLELFHPADADGHDAPRPQPRTPDPGPRTND